MQKIILLGSVIIVCSVCCFGSSLINSSDINQSGEEALPSSSTKKVIQEVPTNIVTEKSDKTITTSPTSTSYKSPTITYTKGPTKTPQPTNTATTKPGASLEGIYLLYLSTTELQFKEYMSYTYGEKINEQVVVGQVLDDGNVALAGEWSEFYYGVYDFCVILQNVPKDIALSYVKGHSIQLEATVYGLIGDYGYYYDCETTLLLKYLDSY